jgi:hypothetical protein
VQSNIMHGMHACMYASMHDPLLDNENQLRLLHTTAWGRMGAGAYGSIWHMGAA